MFFFDAYIWKGNRKYSFIYNMIVLASIIVILFIIIINVTKINKPPTYSPTSNIIDIFAQLDAESKTMLDISKGASSMEPPDQVQAQAAFDIIGELLEEAIYRHSNLSANVKADAEVFVNNIISHIKESRVYVLTASGLTKEDAQRIMEQEVIAMDHSHRARIFYNNAREGEFYAIQTIHYIKSLINPEDVALVLNELNDMIDDIQSLSDQAKAEAESVRLINAAETSEFIAKAYESAQESANRAQVSADLADQAGRSGLAHYDRLILIKAEEDKIESKKTAAMESLKSIDKITLVLGAAMEGPPPETIGEIDIVLADANDQMDLVLDLKDSAQTLISESHDISADVQTNRAARLVLDIQDLANQIESAYETASQSFNNLSNFLSVRRVELSA